MSRISIAAASSVLVALVASGLPASADLVTFDFVVELTSVRDTENVFGGALSVGDEVTGQFMLDTSTPDEWPLPNGGMYSDPVVSLTGTVGGIPFNGPGPQADQILISVPAIGPYEYTMTEDPFFLDTRATFRLWMQDTTRSWTSGDALPTAPYSYFDGSSFSFAARQDAIKLEGIVTSFTPEPGTLALLAMGIMVAAGRTRKRDKNPASAGVSAAGPVVARLFLSLVFVIIGTSPAAAADPTCGCTDIVFVIDTTGSIDEAIASLADSNGLRAVVDAAVATSGGDLRVGLITFDGAYGGGHDYLRVHSSLTAEIDDVRVMLGDLQSFQDNGGRWPEASDEAIREVLRTTPWESYGGWCVESPNRFESPWRPECIKHAIFFTDNVPGGCDDDYVCEIDEVNALTRARQSAAAGIMITSVYVGGFPSASPGIERIMRRHAVMTSGTYVPVSIYATGPDGMGISEVLQAVVGVCPDCNKNGINDLLDVAPGGGSMDCNTNSVPDECEPDCNGNGIPDSCDILTGTSLDVNTNAHPDECDIDCNSDGDPDECEPDCDGDGIPDLCELPPIGTSANCNGNLIPDECEADCDGDGVPDECELPPYGSSLDCNDNDLPDECEEDCNNNTIPDDCDVRDCTGTPPPILCADCNSNGIPDSCDRDAGWPDLDGNDILDDCEDCNTNSIPDTCDLSCVAPGCFGVPGCGQETDLNGNDLPDSCEDCNHNGVPDDLDLSLGTSPDCNGNDLPDECDIADCPRLDPTCQDCNANDVPDSCDLTAGTSEDCNHNQIPDECDIANCKPWEWGCRDCNGNGVPDSCDLAAETSQDCNQNQVPDECDLATGTSEDCQPDGIPDECQISLFQTQPDPPYYCNPYITTCSADLDINGVPDECQDCNDNSIFDPCEIWCRPFCDPENCGFAPELPCSSNGIPDDCDVDCNDNDVPDTCECFYGDYDRDGDSDLFDFAAFQNCVNTNGGPVSFDCDCAFDLYPLAGGPGIGDDDTTAADHPFYQAYLAGATGGPRTPCWEGHPYAPRRVLTEPAGLDAGGEALAAEGMAGGPAMPAMFSASEENASASESDAYPTPAPLTLELRPVRGGDPVTVLTAHTTYELYYSTTLTRVNDVILFGVARSAEQGLASAGRAQMSDWCSAETFYFRDILADGCEPVPVGWAPEGFARYQLVVGDFWSAAVGAASSEPEAIGSAGPSGLLCTITTGEPGLLYLEMYLSWINRGTEDYEESYGHVLFEVAAP